MLRFFKPKHTVESIVKDLVDGFDEGSIVLSPEEARLTTRESLEQLLRDRMAYFVSREKWIALVAHLFGLIGVLLSVYLGVLAEKVDQEVSGIFTSLHLLILFLTAGVVVLAGSVVLLRGLVRAAEKKAELKTVDRILEMGELKTAQQLASRLIKFRRHLEKDNKPIFMGKERGEQE